MGSQNRKRISAYELKKAFGFNSETLKTHPKSFGTQISNLQSKFYVPAC